MPANDSVLTPSQARTRLISVLALALLAAAAGLGVILWHANSAHPRQVSDPGPRPAGSASETPTSGRSAVVGAPNIGPVTVLTGNELANGIYLGYPHTTQGAISAADQYMTQYLSTLDPDRGAAIARLTADTSFANAPTVLASAIGTERQGLGLPSTGQVPANYTLATTPVEYQLRDETSDTVTVLLLAEVSKSTPANGASSNVAVLAVAMHWDGRDWKLLPPPDGDPYLQLAATPDTSQAAQNGWADLMNG